MKALLQAGLVVLGLTLHCVAYAQPTSARRDGAGEVDAEIVVTGERLHEMARSFVEEMSVSSPANDQLAAWDRQICPTLAGLNSQSHAQYLLDRIAQRAFEVDVRTGPPGCSPNILIFITPQADRLAREIVDDHKSLVGYYAATGLGTLGRGPLEEFATAAEPVRWWHVAQTTSSGGQRIGEGRGTQVIRSAQATRLRRNTQESFLRVLIIVDAEQASGVSYQALADYLAMVSLAQLEPGADVSSVPTILNLFQEPRGERPRTLTAWDQAYLEGLYGMRRDAPNSHWQQRDIVRQVERDVIEDAR